jgi:hypothetical protein
MNRYPTIVTPPGRYKYVTTEHDYPIRSGGAWDYHSRETAVVYSDFSTKTTRRWQWSAGRLVWENRD